MGRNVMFSTFIKPTFNSDSFLMGGYEKIDADICLECSNKISDAQNKAIEEIKLTTSL